MRSRGRRIMLPHPTRSTLVGYHVRDAADVRRKVLRRRVKTRSYGTVISELKLIATLNERRPGTHRALRADMAYLKKRNRSQNLKSSPVPIDGERV